MFRYTYPLDCLFLIRLQKEFYDLCFLKVPFFFIHLCVKVSPDGQYTRFLSGSCTKYSSFARFCIFFWCSINTATYYFLFCFIHNFPTHRTSTIIAESVLIIKNDATVQLRILTVLLRKPGRLDVPCAGIIILRF